MTITDERKEKLDFSEPYFDAEQALLVKKGSGIKSFDDLKGKKLGAQLATTGEDVRRGEQGGQRLQRSRIRGPRRWS